MGHPFKMSSYSDAFLSSANWWLGWIAIIGTSLGLLSAVATHVARREISQRQTVKDAAKEQRLLEAERRVHEQTEKLASSTQKLEAAEQAATKARELAENLREKAAPRRLSEAQIKAIRGVLIRAPARTRIDLGFRSDDPEGADFSMQIVELLSSMNFDVHWFSMALVKIPDGIFLNTGYNNQATSILMQQALEATGMKYTYGKIGGAPAEPQNTEILLLIGSKP